jgi:anaerobic ribonucleoside-triphosphate reductase activating protein
LVQQVALGLAAGVLGASAGRMGVWVQGCSLPHCPGCTSAHTHDAADARARRLAVADLLRLAHQHQPTGLTVSGGEPTDQAASVLALLQGFKQRWPEREVVLYTGLRWAVFARRFAALAEVADVVVAGPYVRHLPATPLAGSANQEVKLLTPLAERLFADHARWPLHRLQVASHQAQHARVDVVTVGIPHSPRLRVAQATLQQPVLPDLLSQE